ncbi:MAG: hypothetical protein HYX92_21835 [Chloroflexi bacterium]|nr:hypothetical protein [Chloroflexota bacterium]
MYREAEPDHKRALAFVHGKSGEEEQTLTAGILVNLARLSPLKAIDTRTI